MPLLNVLLVLLLLSGVLSFVCIGYGATRLYMHLITKYEATLPRKERKTKKKHWLEKYRVARQTQTDILDPFELFVGSLLVCMYRGRPLWRCPWDWAFQLGQGERPIELVGLISQPHGTAGSYLRTIVRFLSQLYFRQLRVSCVLM